MGFPAFGASDPSIGANAQKQCLDQPPVIFSTLLCPYSDVLEVPT